MIKITSNGREIANAMGKVTDEIIKGYRESIKEIAIEGKQMAQALAPIKSGELKRGISYRIFKTKAELFSVVSGFPYNFWVNKTEPLRILHFRKRNPYFAVPQEVGYGMHLISPSGNPIQWTGTAGFFDIASEYMNNRIINNLNPKIERALKSK